MATITYRKLDQNGDPLWGNGQGSFCSDIDAVAQAIYTRLRLLLGEWWENLSLGTPLFQSMLGQSASDQGLQAAALLLKQRIQGSPYVISVYNSAITRAVGTRDVSYVAYVNTKFGTLIVSFTPPGAAAGILP
jgi:hypothetical protein